MAKRGKIPRIYLLIGAFTLLLIVSIVFLFLVFKKEDALKGADQAIRLSAQGGFNCEYAEAQKLYAFGEGVLKVTEDRIAYLTLSGNEVFSTGVSYRNPQCHNTVNTAVVFDLDGYAFTLLTPEGIRFSTPTDNKIKSAILSDSGSLVAIITESENESAYGDVHIYDNDGNRIAYFTSSDSGYPISGVFSHDESFFALTTLNTVGAVPAPYIRMFALSSTGAGTTVSDYGVYTTDSDDIFGPVVYAGNRLYTFSTNKIYTIENDSLVTLGNEYGVINQVTAVNDVVFVVYADGVEQMNKIAVIDTSGQTIYSSAVGSELNAVASNEERYALSIDRRIYVFNRNGSVIADISVDEEVLRMGFIANNKLIIISTGGVHTIDY
ncbi:MAG: hypothetical protein J5685_03770 [Clostridiales bacterium]|nr:hypothetical protein [Clostridiales bacterium]